MANLVASSANAGLGVASTTCTVTVAATSPDTLLVLFIAANSFAVSSIAMGGGVWTQALNGTNNSNFTKAWIGRNVAAGTTTGTITFGGSTASGVQSQEWAGLTSVVGTNVPAFATSTAVSAGPTTPAWGQNVVLGMFVSNTGGVSGPSGGFTGLTPLVWTGTRNMASGYLIQTQPTPATIGWTITSGAWDCVLAGFQAYEDSAYDPVQSRRRRTPQGLRARFLRTWSEDTVAAVFTNASAEVASGTGAAFGPSIAIAPNAGAPAGTGTSNAPSVSLAPNAGNGAGTGAAGGPTSSVAPVIQAASGTGSASSPAASIKPSAGATAGTGTASSPSIALAPTAGAATGTGVSQSPSEALLVPAGAATGTGAANAPAVSIKATAGLASGTGAAANPAISVAPTMGTASGTGAAFDPTVSTSASVSAAAGLATATGTAFDATVQTSIPTPVTGGQPPIISGALPPHVSGSARTTVPIGSAEILKPGV